MNTRQTTKPESNRENWKHIESWKEYYSYLFSGYYPFNKKHNIKYYEKFIVDRIKYGVREKVVSLLKNLEYK